MENKHTQITGFFSAAFLVFAGGVFTVQMTAGTQAVVMDAKPTLAAAEEGLHAAAPLPDEPESPKASSVSVSAFQKRAQKAFGAVLDEQAATKALAEHQKLLSSRLTVEFVAQANAASGSYTEPLRLAVNDHQPWIKVTSTPTSVDYALDEAAIHSDIRSILAEKLPTPSWATITGEVTDRFGNTRLTATGSVRPGYIVDINAISTDIAGALMKGSTKLNIPVVYDAGGVIRTFADGTTQKMTLLAHGRSNYAHSPWGRVVNIHKALSEQLNGSYVGTGATFHFNDILQGATGWAEGLAIFEGGALRPVLGGGICQAATTMYRAIVKAGLPVTERAPHSLYVTYYKAYGVGIDATIFPGAQDLSFVNDTGHPILILSRYEGDDAFVDLYGTPDGRQVTLTGPYFTSTAPADFTVEGRGLSSNEIGWKQIIRWPDGKKADDQIVSRYRSVPSSLSKEDFTVGNAAAI